MGAMDSIPGLSTVKDFLGYGPGAQQPGAGATKTFKSEAERQAWMQTVRQNPDGTFTDPATGTRYSDPSGQRVVATPNVTQQAGANFDTSRDILGRTGASDAEHAQVFAGQNDVLGQLNRQRGQLDNTINNPNASSVAGTMLAINNDRNASGALGSAAGVGGNNAFAARRQALQSIAQGNIGTAQNAALLRAKESADAMAMKTGVANAQGNILGAQSQAGNQRYGIDSGAATNYAQLANTGQTAVQGLNQKTNAQDKLDDQDFGDKLISGIASWA